jgi:magnesium transporter
MEVVQRLRDNLDATDAARLYYQDVIDHIDGMADTAALCVEVLGGWLQQQTDIANDRLNKVMKYLTVVSTLLLPMTVISGVFGMNFQKIPTLDDPLGFWKAIAMMTVSALALMGWFRYKRWL